MGKGDSRTRRGKIYQGSFGKTRPHRPPKKAEPAPVPVPAAPARGRSR